MSHLLRQRKAVVRKLNKEWRRGDRGFTLIELTIVVMILPLVVGAIAIGLVSVFNLQTKTSSRLSGSGDLQVVNATFVKDVQSAETITTESSPTECGNSGTQLLGMVWSSGQTAVSYVKVPVNNSTTNFSLERTYCTLGKFTAPDSTTVISADLYGDQATTNPVEICAPTYSNSNCSATPVAPTSATTIAAVLFPLSVPMSSGPYTMIASPRAGGATSGGAPTLKTQNPPLLLLGTSCSSPVLTVGGTNNHTNGGLTINVYPGSGNGYLGVMASCSGSITLANGGSIQAGAILTSSPTPVAISAGNGATYPPQYAWSLPPSDPFAGLVAPRIPDKTTEVGSCGLPVNNTYTCSPGYYATSPTFANGNNGKGNKNATTIIFSGNADYTNANYYFGTDFTLPNGSTTVFGPGAYIFGAADQGAFTTGANGTTITGDSALFYSPSGSISFGNGANIQLTPPTQWLGINGSAVPSQDVTVWNGATYNSSTGVGVVSLGNNGTSTNTANSYGGIYVPNGEVIDSNNGAINTAFIVANTATFANGLVVNITAPSTP